MGAGNAAEKAADAQVKAAKMASDTQMKMFEENKQLLSPFVQMGYQGGNMLMDQLPQLTAPINMNQQTLEQTPGYKFALNQGLSATQNQMTKMGLGQSGAAAAAAGKYATGLADQTYQQQFNDAWTNKINPYNMMMGTTQLGANAASGQAQLGTQTATNIAQNQMQAGQAQAGYYMQEANAQNQLFSSLLGFGAMALL